MSAKAVAEDNFNQIMDQVCSAGLTVEEVRTNLHKSHCSNTLISHPPTSSKAHQQKTTSERAGVMWL